MYRRLLRLYGRGVDTLDRWTSAFCALLLAAAVFLTGSEIVGRSMFAQSSVEVVDVALQLAIVMYFIGYLSLLNRDQDIMVDYFYVRFPLRVRRAIDLITAIAIAGFFLMLLAKSIALFRLGLRFPHPVFPVPNALIVSPAVLGAAGGLLVALRKLLDTLDAQFGSSD
jgi:TRAP-type C4-dicarboxylate transport system permease small subunit